MKNTIRKTYSWLRKRTPTNLNSILTKLVFKFSNKPFVKQDKIDAAKKFPNHEKGGLIISADFEMAWAWRFSKTGKDYLKKGEIERKNFPKILEILESYNIPITFSTVGHLFLEKCDKGDHDWMKRIPHFDDHWKFTDGDWYYHDPYSNYQEAPEWYAPDLIQMIIDSKVNHEIATHTFSHIDFSYKNCPAGVAEDELKACKMAAEPYDITLNSMVFPGGTWGNIEVLKAHGIQIYRKNVEHDLAYPWRDEYGILVTNSSEAMEYNPAYGWSDKYFLKRLKKYIDKAIKTNTIAHLWFHPSLDPYILKNVFPSLLEYAAERREAGDLWIGTMEEIAEHINKNLKKLMTL
jgi:peptidoglycan/xylan/chitin deacetylase (PgdA/CDA1 family)